MYFLVSASPPKRLDVATSNLQMLWLALKLVFAMVYYRMKSSTFFILCKSTFQNENKETRACIGLI